MKAATQHSMVYFICRIGQYTELNKFQTSVIESAFRILFRRLEQIMASCFSKKIFSLQKVDFDMSLFSGFAYYLSGFLGEQRISEIGIFFELMDTLPGWEEYMYCEWEEENSDSDDE